MLTASLTDFRKDLRSYIDQITSGLETLIINRGGGKGVVVMSLEEYNSIMATAHELSSRKNEARIDAAIAQFDAGKGTERTLIEP
jgi:antitoxin YefM